MTLTTKQPIDDLELVRQRIAAEKPGSATLPGLLGLYVDLSEEVAKADRWFFCRNLVKTQDDHADPERETPFKPFPDLPYLRHTVAVWDEVSKRPKNRILFVLKSRQVMVSWTALAMVLWSCLFEKGRTIGWQSKKAEDANWMLRRLAGIYERLPERVRGRHRMELREGEMRFPDQKNVVLALPEGPEKSRQYTWSLFVADEDAFQESARETYVAIQPAIRGGGMYVAVSSAAPGFFYDMVEDRAE